MLHQTLGLNKVYRLVRSNLKSCSAVQHSTKMVLIAHCCLVSRIACFAWFLS